MSSSPDLGEQAVIAPSLLPVSVIHKLHAILGRLRTNNRLEKCISIYVEVRSSNVRASLQALDLDYLEISIAEFNDVQSIEGIGLDVWMGCFSKIAAHTGILAFLQFGKTVTETCIEIQNLTRDLIKRVIDGAAEIFWELLVQVELQRQILPPSDGNVPILVSIITDYCGRATARDLVKKRLKNFKEAFDEMCKRQSSWVVPDRDLRDKICQQIVQAVVPVYRSYMQSYGPLVELDGSSSKYANYSVQTLEQMLSSLFLPKPGRYSSFKGRQLSAKFNNGVADLRRTTSAVV
ncbi:hypothetical protein H0E87_028926 [Populus deltoides]|uniref:Exocyst subunit Exo70 family protein n=1 Tax=Populus deltoides TaxID=3696 RepID=A0A8T2WM71_POPDE|nr:hypothetical protein H0E87_028926 [Populus deltoides]